jgi:hypothetical protein
VPAGWPIFPEKTFYARPEVCLQAAWPGEQRGSQMPGPPPIPFALRKLRGNPSKRRLRAGPEPQIPKSCPPPPNFLNAYAQDEAPHNWLLSYRIEVAKVKLRDGRSSLSEVALACGFADQSHLTRVFTRIVGISPGAWRRAVAE